MPSLKTLVWLALLLVPVLGMGQDIKLPAELKGEAGTFIEVKATTTDTLVKWRSVDSGLMLFPAHLLKESKVAVVLAMKEGRYRLLAVTAKDGTPSDFAECVVVIGNPQPVPIPPGPTPIPPDPPVPPTPPQPVTGPLRVLFLYETGTSLPREVDLTLASTKVREYLFARCEKSSDGVAEWRTWDDDYTPAQIPPNWTATYDLAKREASGRGPWLLIEQKGQKVHSGPIGGEAETLATLRKWGGE